MKKAAVIIPNYNGAAYLEDCLRSLEANKTELFDVIVVDNGSDDGSQNIAPALSGERTWISQIRLEENTGFSKAVNEGIRAARTEYVILLNNDTKAAPDFVERLVEAADADAGIFSAGAKMLSMREPDRIDGAGDFYCALGWAFARGKGQSAGRYAKPGQIFSACAGAALYRREMLDRIGLFDEKHFAYLEDVDLGYRARLYGFQNVYAPGAVVYHAGSAVSGSRHNAFKVGLSSRNSVYLVYKNMPLWQILLNAPFLAAGFALKALFFASKGLGAVYIRGLWQGVRLCLSEEGRGHKVRGIGPRSCMRVQLRLWGNLFRKILWKFF